MIAKCFLLLDFRVLSVFIKRSLIFYQWRPLTVAPYSTAEHTRPKEKVPFSLSSFIKRSLDSFNPHCHQPCAWLCDSQKEPGLYGGSVSSRRHWLIWSSNSFSYRIFFTYVFASHATVSANHCRHFVWCSVSVWLAKSAGWFLLIAGNGCLWDAYFRSQKWKFQKSDFLVVGVCVAFDVAHLVLCTTVNDEFHIGAQEISAPQCKSILRYCTALLRWNHWDFRSCYSICTITH